MDCCVFQCPSPIELVSLAALAYMSWACSLPTLCIMLRDLSLSMLEMKHQWWKPGLFLTHSVEGTLQSVNQTSMCRAGGSALLPRKGLPRSDRMRPAGFGPFFKTRPQNGG